MRPTFGANGVTALYMTLRNTGGSEDALTGISTPVAAQCDVHRTTIENGVASMRPAGEVSLAAGGTVTLDPEGLHAMVMGLTRKLTAGEHVHVHVTFRTAPPVDVEAVVSMQAPGS